MKDELTRQIYLFMIFILNGCIIGILFDLFRVLRKTFKTSDIITSMQDILFCVLTGLLLIYNIFIFNNGEIRLYVIIGLLMGLILYMVLLSKYIIKISVNTICILKRIISPIFNIIVFPVKSIFSFIKKSSTFIVIKIKKFLSIIFNINIKLLSNKEKVKKIKK